MLLSSQPTPILDSFDDGRRDSSALKLRRELVHPSVQLRNTSSAWCYDVYERGPTYVTHGAASSPQVICTDLPRYMIRVGQHLATLSTDDHNNDEHNYVLAPKPLVLVPTAPRVLELTYISITYPDKVFLPVLMRAVLSISQHLIRDLLLLQISMHRSLLAILAQ